jgi:hypothetical protein
VKGAIKYALAGSRYESGMSEEPLVLWLDIFSDWRYCTLRGYCRTPWHLLTPVLHDHDDDISAPAGANRAGDIE